MTSRLRRLAGVLFVMLGLTIGSMGSAQAVTGGEPDGNQHPNVGLILFYSPDGRFRCSATLVTPTVLLTAAHCTVDTVGKTLVDFRSVVANQPPTGYPVAANPAAGYTQAEIEAAGFLSGTAYAHPDYSNFTDLDNWNDVGVIVLDHPVTGIAPAAIAPRNYLDAYAQPRLNKTLFTSVGYGTEVRKPDSGPQKPTPETYPLIRRLRRPARPEADQPDPAAQRQPQRHQGHRRHLLRRLRRPDLPQRLRRHGDQLQLHRQLPLPRGLPAGGHQGRAGLAGDVRGVPGRLIGGESV